MIHQHLTILVVRHAESVPPTSGVGTESERDRPLTERGLRDADFLAESLADMKPDKVFSSPYRRSIQTVSPLARKHGLSVELIEDLRERLLSSDPLPDWKSQLKRCWRDFEYAPPGGETGKVAQARVLAVLEHLRIRYPSGLLVLGSHGNLISLAIAAFAPEVGFEFWEAMPTPAVYRVEYRDSGWHAVAGPNFYC
jgi:2,3-bisphosphoglycerate-dependent phosphoglycerate mutase